MAVREGVGGGVGGGGGEPQVTAWWWVGTSVSRETSECACSAV